MERYDPKKIDTKWKRVWLSAKIYEPDFLRAKSPFYNLMMFPYPSAEGLHIGGVRTFTGVDIYGRFKRMQGLDVFEPIGLDGFGIHSENYALKIGKHPARLARVTEKNFYRQLSEIGNGFAWRERLETYDPEYYKWTQWIFTELFRRGLAYRKKAAVNWCPSCKTVLADEQVIAGKCERCSSVVEKRELEQWFFKITDYADRLLQNIEKIDWDEKVKIAQKNWIGKSEGAEIDFEIRTEEKPNFVLLHGYGGSPEKDFLPWLKKELENRGYKVQVPRLPHADKAKAIEKSDMEALFRDVRFDKNTILVGHSLGAIVAMKAAEKLKHPIRKLVLVGGFLEPKFRDHERAFANTFSWEFNFKKIRENSNSIYIVHDRNDHAILYDQGQKLFNSLGGELLEPTPTKSHFNGDREPAVLAQVLDKAKVFTTRPDTLFGATYMVVGPEHPLIRNFQFSIFNFQEVDVYIKNAKKKSDEERIAEGKGPPSLEASDGREKTGVELKGIKAINPANKEEIPVFVADYVLGNVGTGAIMAVPAHDQRDFDFAKKFNLPVKIVVCPHWPEKTCPLLDTAYTGEGHLVASGMFDGTPSKEARKKISDFVGGTWKVQYRLRDWLISRQRYWGPPIPVVFCEHCKKQLENPKSEIRNPKSSRKFTKGELENPGWIVVPEGKLPVKLPFVKNFRPTGSGKSPLASVKSFYETKCPKCGKRARRETDVSDTFLDSAWYYIGYLAKENSKFEIRNSKFRNRAKRWLPVNMYIGGLEHSVLHLLYSRFITMALHDFGHLDFEEPFTKFIGHGLITKDGAKMSKSKGNVVNPDEYIRAYGADAMRMYLAFLAPLTEGGDFRDSGIKGITRFLERVWKFVNSKPQIPNHRQIPNSKLQTIIHKTVKKVTKDIESLQYNTAISALMILLNEFEKTPDAVTGRDIEIFLKLLAPFAPFMAEELWQRRAASYQLAVTSYRSIHREPWPTYDESMLKESSFDLIIQVNGRVRGKISLPADATEIQAKDAALKVLSVRQFVSGEPKRVIFVSNKLINFVV